MPDFNTLKPVENAQPDFATLKPVTSTTTETPPEPKKSIGFFSGPSGDMFSGITKMFGIGQPFLVKVNPTSYVPQVVSNIKDNFERGAKNVISDVSQPFASTATMNPLQGTLTNLQTAGNVAGNVAGTAGGIIGSFISPLLSEGVKQKIGDVTSYVSNKVNSIPGMTPEIAQGLGNVFNTLTLEGAGEAKPVIQAGAKKVSNIASDVGTLAKNILPEAKPSILDTVKIVDDYNRAIKPSIVGKSTAGQIEMANSKVVNGLKAIADNKASLEFVDNEGNLIKGQVPRSVDQLSQSIEQTKRTIYDKYDALAKQAGQQGVTINAPLIAKELEAVVKDRAFQLTNPKAVQYAQDTMDRFKAAGQLDAKTAQDVIQHYNSSLKAFYRNPNYDTASQASIDSMIANKLRSELDNGITGATGEQYQALKNQYGALSSMEKDVARRAAVWGRQNAVSLPNNLANIASGAELVRGLARLNPTDLVVSGAIKGIQKYMQYLNNPDNGISRIFSQIEKSSPSSTGSMSGLGAQGIKGNTYPKSTTESVKPQTIVKKVTQSQTEELPSRFKNGQDLISEIARPKIGEQGLQLRKSELSQLIDHLLSSDNPNASTNRGIIYKPYGYNTDKIADVILGKVNVPRFGDSTIVAEILPNGKLNGNIRIHGTPLDKSSILGKIDDIKLKELSSPKPQETIGDKLKGKIPTQGGGIKVGEIANDVKVFMRKMPEYGLLKDLKAWVDNVDFKTLPPDVTDINTWKKDIRTQLEKLGVDAFNMTDRKIADFADAVLNKAKFSEATIPKDLQPLAKEVMKYKSAEEFANSIKEKSLPSEQWIKDNSTQVSGKDAIDAFKKGYEVMPINSLVEEMNGELHPVRSISSLDEIYNNKEMATEYLVYKYPKTSMSTQKLIDFYNKVKGK